VDIRAAAEDELQLCFDIYLETNNDLEAQRGEDPIAPEDIAWLLGILGHLRQTDPEGVVLAWEGGDAVAFGAAYTREDFWFLAMLDVLPGHQGAGVGRAILEYLLPPGDARGSMTLATTVETIHPVSTMLYARYGIVPRAPLYWLRDLARPDALPALPAGVTARPVGSGDQTAFDHLDRELVGYARPQDHAMWAELSGLARAYVRDNGTVAGYAYLGPDGWLGPVAAAEDALVPAIVREIIDVRGGDQTDVVVTVPGYADVALRALLLAGMRSPAGAAALYCSTGRMPSPRYLPFGGYLP
jgi:GNAT superfamily N-acetyltransferase